MNICHKLVNYCHVVMSIVVKNILVTFEGSLSRNPSVAQKEVVKITNPVVCIDEEEFQKSLREMPNLSI